MREATFYRKSILDYATRSRGYEHYMGLAEEVVQEESIPGVIASVERAEQRSRPTQRKTRFLIRAPEASSVKILGSFNNWAQSKGFVMRRCEDGSWSKEIILPPGLYQYKFLVDEKWMEDKGNPNEVEDPYGGRNSVIEVH